MYRKRLMDLKMPADILGFEYFNYALQIYIPTQQMKTLYMDVAEKFKTTPSRAERAMRHAITKTNELDCDGNFITVGQFIAKYKILWND